MVELTEEEKKQVREWCAIELERLDAYGDLTIEACETGEDYYELAKQNCASFMEKDNVEGYLHIDRCFNLEVDVDEMTDAVVAYIKTLDFEEL